MKKSMSETWLAQISCQKPDLFFSFVLFYFPPTPHRMMVGQIHLAVDDLAYFSTHTSAVRNAMRLLLRSEQVRQNLCADRVF